MKTLTLPSPLGGEDKGMYGCNTYPNLSTIKGETNGKKHMRYTGF